VVDFTQSNGDSVLLVHEVREDVASPRRAIFQNFTVMAKLLDIQQMAKIYRVTSRTIEQRLKKGRCPLPVTPPGCKRLWNADDVEAALCRPYEREKMPEPQSAAERMWEEALIDAELAKYGL